MSSTIDLRIEHVAETLRAVNRTASEFAKKEADLLRDLRNRRFAINRKHREGVEKLEGRLSAEMLGIDESFSTQEERIVALYEGRRERVNKARTAGIRNLPRRAQEARGRWMGDLQFRKFQAERKVNAELKAVSATYNNYTEKLGAERATLNQLEGNARKAFRGYPVLVRLLAAKSHAPAEHGFDPDEVLQALRVRIGKAQELMSRFRQFIIARAFSDVPLPFLIVPILLIGGVLAIVLGAGTNSYLIGGAVALGLLGMVWAIHQVGLRQARGVAAELSTALAAANALHAHALELAEGRRARDRNRAQSEYDIARNFIDEQWERADEIETEFHKHARKKIETQAPRVLATIDRLLPPKLAKIAAEHTARIEAATGIVAERKEQFIAAHHRETVALDEEERERWRGLKEEWHQAINSLFETIAAQTKSTGAAFPPWNSDVVKNWIPPERFARFVKFAELHSDLAKAPTGIPQSADLALPGSPLVVAPLALDLAERGSLLFETNESGGPAVIGTLNNIMLRLLSTTPPGKLSFTIIDPVGLGQNFAGLMHLADYEESLINRRIWTQRDQIEERLAELGEHIEKVIQMYLRNEYATITEYNEQAGSVAEKYHFIVVADFPANFSEIAAKRLQSIATSGPRCGIFTLIHWDKRQPLPDGFVPDELRKQSICIRRENGGFALSNVASDGALLVLEREPEPDLALGFVHKVGQSSIDSNRVEVPFLQIAPEPSEMWKNETTNELRVAIGRTGATKLQYLAIGKGTRQHALFAGKTGSGKSTLFHVIITNLALACSPEQVEFYLVDFKKGVEFKCYATKQLPHARVVAIESDREFALSVLQRVDEELKRRGDMFRKLGVQDIAGYKRAGGTEPIPRCLLIIDEFQEFFVEDDSIAQTASLLFDRIVRQGRAFGIHVLLGSQTLGGAYSLARATLGQMVIRVALQCNEADAYLIMDDNNSAPRLLSRPGEGIYNDAAGAVEGNSPFQVVWLPDEERDEWLDKVRELAERHHEEVKNPIVFEGNVPADIRDNPVLGSLLHAAPRGLPAAGRVWFGAPNSIKGPTQAVFHRQSGNNLLIIGQREEAALTMVGLALIALAAQYPPGAARLVFLCAAAPESRDAEFLERVSAVLPHDVTIGRIHDVAEIINELALELKARAAGDRAADAGPVFLFIHGLHRFKKLRQEDEFSFSSSDADAAPNPAVQLNELIDEGSSHGIHLIATLDTLNNVNRFLSRKALSEFEMRIVFQMSANDSASLIDSPRASALGLHRALFYNEHEGYLETFRPYAMPDPGWIDAAGAKLASRTANAGLTIEEDPEIARAGE